MAHKRAVPIHAKGAEANLPLLRALRETQMHAKAQRTFTQRARSKAFPFAASACRLCASAWNPSTRKERGG